MRVWESSVGRQPQRWGSRALALLSSAKGSGSNAGRKSWIEKVCNLSTVEDTVDQRLQARRQLDDGELST